MNPYTVLGYGVGTSEATALSEQLAIWHDAMVSHERQLRAGYSRDVCDEDCPHGEAPALWAKAVAMFGERADVLSFLRSRAINAARGFDDAGGHAGVETSEPINDRRSNRRTRRADGDIARQISAADPG
jgi:hypothetical protein